MLKSFPPTLVCIVAVLAPLPFGSAEPFWGAVWCAFLALAILVAAGQRAVDARLKIPIAIILLIVALWCVIVFLQYSPVGSPLPAARGWDETAKLLGGPPLAANGAAYGALPIAAVVPSLAIVLSLLAGIFFGSDGDFRDRLFAWVAWAGLAYAVYSVFAELTNPTMLLWLNKSAYVDDLTGTFINHNTAATFFGSITIIWYLRVLRDLRRRFDLSQWRGVDYVYKR